MTRRILPALLAFLCIGLPAALPGLDDPEFKTDEGQAAFAKGQEQFELNLWELATKSFSTARKDATGSGKKLVDPWLKACKGGKKLDKLASKEIRDEKWDSAWKKLKSLQKTFGDTPLRMKLFEKSQKVLEQLYLVLAQFEEGSPELQPEFLSYSTDLRYVKSGVRSLQWSTGPSEALFCTFAALDGRKLRECRYFQMWIWVETPCDFALCFYANEKNTVLLSQDNKIRGRNLHHLFSVKKPGWFFLQFDLRQLTVLGEEKFHNVSLAGLVQLDNQLTQTVFIDEAMARLPKKKQ